MVEVSLHHVKQPRFFNKILQFVKEFVMITGYNTVDPNYIQCETDVIVFHMNYFIAENTKTNISLITADIV